MNNMKTVEFEVKGENFRLISPEFDGGKLQQIKVQSKHNGRYYFACNLFRPCGNQRRPTFLRIASGKDSVYANHDRMARKIAKVFPFRALEALFPFGE